MSEQHVYCHMALGEIAAPHKCKGGGGGGLHGVLSGSRKKQRNYNVQRGSAVNNVGGSWGTHDSETENLYRES